MKPTVRLLMLLIVLVALVAGCGDDASPTPVPRTAVPIVITRVVTPGPTETLAPTPTLAYDLTSVAGTWGMRFQFDLTGSSFAEEFGYWGFADVVIGLDGGITGSGHFQPNLSEPTCTARALDSEPIAFTITGNSYAVGDQVWVNMAMLPTDRSRVENYEIICPEIYNDVRIINQPILWHILDALKRREWPTANYEHLTWNFALQSNQALPIEADLVQETGGVFQGNLNGEARIWRN